MSIQKFRSSPNPDFDESADYDYSSVAGPEYDEGNQVSYDVTDSDYSTDFADIDSEPTSQDWYARKQK